MGASIVAVVGTIVGIALGAVMGYYFERRAAVDAAKRARAETLRQERSTAYAQFAGALGTYRRAQIDRWGSETAEAVRDTNSRRDAAREAMFRVQLLAGSATVRDGARRAFDAMDAFSDAKSGEEARVARDGTWAAMYQFVEIARMELDEALAEESS